MRDRDRETAIERETEGNKGVMEVIQRRKEREGKQINPNIDIKR